MKYWPVPNSYSKNIPNKNSPGSFWENRKDRFHCGAINTMEDFCVINNVMHERCSNCGYLQEMSLVRCLKKKEWSL